MEKYQYIVISGQRLFYRIIGRGSPLVLIHGHAATGSIWRGVLPLLARHYQVIVVDLPGHGRSHFTGTWRLREVAPLLVRWLREMELPPVALIGHSMGGAIAIHIAASAPELISHLILVDSAGLPLRDPIPILAARSIGSFFQPGNGSYSPQELYNHLFMPPSPRHLWESAWEVVTCDLRAELASISAPTLIVWGEHDLLLPLSLGRELYAALPHATFVTVPHCGHLPILAQPAAFCQIVRRFLQRGNSHPIQD